MFAATTAGTITTAAVGCGVSIVATPIGGAAAGAGVGVAVSGGLTKLGTKLAKKYPCLKEEAKKQAALNELKTEMRAEFQQMLKDQLAADKAAAVLDTAGMTVEPQDSQEVCSDCEA